MSVSLAEPRSAPGWIDSFLPRRDAPYLAVTSLVAILAAIAMCLRSPDALLAPALVTLAGLGALVSAGDAVTRHIPNRANALCLASAAPLLGLAQLGDHGSLLRAGLGAGAAFGAYLALWLVSPAGMGLGDVKLSPYLGAYMGYFGWSCWTRGIVFGFLVQGLIVGVGLACRRLHAKSHVAHGPAMCLGTIAALVVTLPNV